MTHPSVPRGSCLENNIAWLRAGWLPCNREIWLLFVSYFWLDLPIRWWLRWGHGLLCCWWPYRNRGSSPRLVQWIVCLLAWVLVNCRVWLGFVLLFHMFWGLVLETFPAVFWVFCANITVIVCVHILAYWCWGIVFYNSILMWYHSKVCHPSPHLFGRFALTRWHDDLNFLFWHIWLRNRWRQG